MSEIYIDLHVSNPVTGLEWPTGFQELKQVHNYWQKFINALKLGPTNPGNQVAVTTKLRTCV